jgi:hypothetical protein
VSLSGFRAFFWLFWGFMARFTAEHGVIAIDEMLSRRPFDRASDMSALLIVYAWICEEWLVLARVATNQSPMRLPPYPDCCYAVARRQFSHGAMSSSRHMSDELSRHMPDFGFWVLCLRQAAPDAFKSDIDGGDADGAF